MARWLLACLLIGLPLGCLSAVRPIVVVGSSMAPALHSGQLALLRRDYYRSHALETGDVVAFRWQGTVYLKRVYALAGERVKLLRADGYLTPIPLGAERMAAVLAHRPNVYQISSLTVPPGHFYALGDHLPGSVDSRAFGSVPTSAILGRVQTLGSSLLPLGGDPP